MKKIKIEDELFARVKTYADLAGYATVDEFVAHALENELSQLDDAEDEEEAKKRLKGLGYLE